MGDALSPSTSTPGIEDNPGAPPTDGALTETSVGHRRSLAKHSKIGRAEMKIFFPFLMQIIAVESAAASGEDVPRDVD